SAICHYELSSPTSASAEASSAHPAAARPVTARAARSGRCAVGVVGALRALGASSSIPIELVAVLRWRRRRLVVPPAVLVLLPAAALLLAIDVAVAAGVNIAAAGSGDAARALRAPARDGLAASAALRRTRRRAPVVGDSRSRRPLIAAA